MTDCLEDARFSSGLTDPVFTTGTDPVTFTGSSFFGLFVTPLATIVPLAGLPFSGLFLGLHGIPEAIDFTGDDGVVGLGVFVTNVPGPGLVAIAAGPGLGIPDLGIPEPVLVTVPLTTGLLLATVPLTSALLLATGLLLTAGWFLLELTAGTPLASDPGLFSGDLDNSSLFGLFFIPLAIETRPSEAFFVDDFCGDRC